MNISTIDRKVTESKPLKYVSIGGIILAIIAFFVMVFLCLKFLFGLGLHFAIVIQDSYAHQARVSGTATSTPSSVFMLPQFANTSQPHQTIQHQTPHHTTPQHHTPQHVTPPFRSAS